jgi:hypothetical protein
MKKMTEIQTKKRRLAEEWLKKQRLEKQRPRTEKRENGD